MASRQAKTSRKSVTKKAKKGGAKKSVGKKGVERKGATIKPKESVSKELNKSVESSGWKKPASTGNRPPSSGPVLRSMCLLFKLPLELRLMIYSDVIDSGSLELLRSCQKIYREAVEVIPSGGIYRLAEFCRVSLPYYVYGKEQLVLYKKDSIGDRIQHLEVYVFPHSGNTDPNKEIFDVWAQYPELKTPKISRKNCWIHLSIDQYLADLLNPPPKEKLIKLLEAFHQFENVFLNIEARFIESFDNRHDYGLRRSIARTGFECWFRTLGVSLEPFIGPLTWHDSHDTDKRYWEFHPCRESQKGWWALGKDPEGEKNIGWEWPHWG